uniref:Phosphatidylinositol-specific phospholipase C X domain-containing protein n=1 Tax=Anopheles atroparvus TaxID=41427 RepID=A0A182ISQ1_ANOAO
MTTDSLGEKLTADGRKCATRVRSDKMRLNSLGCILVTVCGALATLFVGASAEACPVFLTISAYSRSIEDAPLVINWGPGCESPPDWIGLYTENPALSSAPPIAKVLVNGEPSGQVVSAVKFGHQKLPGGWSYEQVLQHIPKRKSKPICFDFYLTSYGADGQLQYFDCLKIQPAWMFAESSLGNMTLKDLFLPGTHCSGCYQTRTNAGNVVLKKIGFRQSLDIWSQLVFGVRYLDFSVGYYPSHNGTRNFWIMNEHFRVASLGPLLQDIRRFVILSEETVFLDFRRFPLGFHNHPEQHAVLLALLEQELGDLVYRRQFLPAEQDDEGEERGTDGESYHLTIGDMRREGKYILITYNHEASLNESDIVWKPWKKHSSAFLKHTELEEFMQNLFSQKHPDAPKDIGWSLHGVQGFQGSYNEEDATYLLPKERASIVNPKLMHLLRGPWSLSANAVLLDFFANTNLVDLAVYTNRYKILHNAMNEAVVLDIQ